MSTSAVLPSSSVKKNEWNKHPNTSDSEDPVYSKRKKLEYYYVLESEDSLSEDEGSESVDSIQDKETDYCKDTTDTDTKSELSYGDFYTNSEELSDSKSEYSLSSQSSSDEDGFLADTIFTSVVITEDDDDYEENITNNNNNNTTTNKLLNTTNQICVKCGSKKLIQYFVLCSNCYQDRKNNLPPRPQTKKI